MRSEPSFEARPAVMCFVSACAVRAAAGAGSAASGGDGVARLEKEDAESDHGDGGRENARAHAAGDERRAEVRARGLVLVEKPHGQTGRLLEMPAALVVKDEVRPVFDFVAQRLEREEVVRELVADAERGSERAPVVVHDVHESGKVELLEVLRLADVLELDGRERAQHAGLPPFSAADFRQMLGEHEPDERRKPAFEAVVEVAGRFALGHGRWSRVRWFGRKRSRAACRSTVSAGRRASGMARPLRKGSDRTSRKRARPP